MDMIVGGGESAFSTTGACDADLADHRIDIGLPSMDLIRLSDTDSADHPAGANRNVLRGLTSDSSAIRHIASIRLCVTQ